MEGRALSAAQVEALERKLAGSPDDLDTRARLIGYYGRQQFQSADAAAALQKHSLWIIQNHLSSSIEAREKRWSTT